MISLGLPAGELRLLCLGAHPDDIEIGCGGTLLSLAESKDVRATYVVATGGNERYDEAVKAASRFLSGRPVDIRVLGLPDGYLPSAWGDLKRALEDVASTVSPDVVFAPRLDDAHQDHRAVAELVGTVWRNSLVLRYEIPKWDGDLGRVTHYVPLDREVARRKLELLDECFPSQVGRDWWDDETFLGLMRLRGVECRHPYAEGFMGDKVVLSLGDAG